jgi:hydroxycarboxylate dehydrogenase B
MNKTIPAGELQARAATIFVASGSTAQEARTVATNLVMANLSGHDSHGIGMLPRYVDAVREGGLLPNQNVAIKLDTGSLLTLDGQRGYGQVIGEQAMKLGIARARTHGSCIMALGNTHHLGRIGHFAEMSVAEGLVSLHFVNVLTRPIVAPFGGADARFGTNPFCIGIPLHPGDAGSSLAAPEGESFILDLATSRVAQGKMRVAHNEGRRVEPGLLIDADGQPTTDPGVVVAPNAPGLFGALLAFGGHKGYGLAVACELLGGALTGGGTASRVVDPKRRAVYNGMLTILIDPAALGTQAAFEHDARDFVDWLRNGRIAPGFDSVRIAGDPERAARLQRGREGITIDSQTWQELVAAAKTVGVDIDANTGA